MAIKKYSTIKGELSKKKKIVKIPKFSEGSLSEIQALLEDIYEKIENLNERVNLLENPK